jgi:hypothetical protein
VQPVRFSQRQEQALEPVTVRLTGDGQLSDGAAAEQPVDSGESSLSLVDDARV